MARRRIEIFSLISILIHLAVFSMAILFLSIKPTLEYLPPAHPAPKKENEVRWIKIDFTPIEATKEIVPEKYSALSWKDSIGQKPVTPVREKIETGENDKSHSTKKERKHGQEYSPKDINKLTKKKNRTNTLEGKGETKPIPLNTRRFEYIDYFSSIKKKINNVWQYPSKAVEMGQNGDTTVQLYIKRDGTVAKVSIYSSSGVKILDKESIRAVLDASPFNPIPKEIEADQLNVIATFSYNLGFVTE